MTTPNEANELAWKCVKCEYVLEGQVGIGNSVCPNCGGNAWVCRTFTNGTPTTPQPVQQSERVVHVNCTKDNCNICDGGLFVCKHCGRAEIELDEPCVPRAAPVPAQQSESAREQLYKIFATALVEERKSPVAYLNADDLMELAWPVITAALQQAAQTAARGQRESAAALLDKLLSEKWSGKNVTTWGEFQAQPHPVIAIREMPIVSHPDALREHGPNCTCENNGDLCGYCQELEEANGTIAALNKSLRTQEHWHTLFDGANAQAVNLAQQLVAMAKRAADLQIELNDIRLAAHPDARGVQEEAKS